MKKLYFAIFVILIGANTLICEAFSFDDNIDVARAVKFYNSIPGLSWRAGTNGFKKIVKLSQLKSKFGLILKHIKAHQENSSHVHDRKEDFDLPLNYDCRTAFPKCTTISSIKDQSNCGSCWAVAAASSFSDRLCIHSKGKVNINMSADQLMACDKKSGGCKGGYLDTAWYYIAENGLVTGGDYGSNEGCRPYSIRPEHSFFAPVPETPKCENTTCPQQYKANNETIVFVGSMEHEIRKEIFKNGPITTGFRVNLSFLFYRSGIYTRFFIDFPMGAHAVRVIGWGEENGIKYWIVANSWGKEWGENGTFRIRRGTNECDFEANVIAGMPQLSATKTKNKKRGKNRRKTKNQYR